MGEKKYTDWTAYFVEWRESRMEKMAARAAPASQPEGHEEQKTEDGGPKTEAPALVWREMAGAREPTLRWQVGWWMTRPMEVPQYTDGARKRLVGYERAARARVPVFRLLGWGPTRARAAEMLRENGGGVARGDNGGPQTEDRA